METIRMICSALGCDSEDIMDLAHLDDCVTNDVYSFTCNKIKYVIRIPGKGAGRLLDRHKEEALEQFAVKMGFDPSFIKMSPTEGWRLSHWFGRSSDHKDPADRKLAMETLRRIHAAPCDFDYPLDVYGDACEVLDRLPKGAMERLAGWKLVDKRCEEVDRYARAQKYPTCVIHGDYRDENILINESGVDIIDWELGGTGNFGLDIGTYIRAVPYSEEEVDHIIDTYLGRTATGEEQIQCYIGIALTAWYAAVRLVEFELMRGHQDLTDVLYHNADVYSRKAQKMIRER